MINEKRLEELKQAAKKAFDAGISETYHGVDHINMEAYVVHELLETLAAALRVVRAAQFVVSLRPKPLPNAGIPELQEALKPFSEEK